MALKKPRFFARKFTKPFSQGHFPVSSKLYWGLAIAALCPLTLWGTTQNFNWTMMALTTFGLAYASKGLRKPKPPR